MDFKTGDLVRFCQGDEARTMLTGRVTREPWGSRKQNISIRTTGQPGHAAGAMYIRLAGDVELIESAESSRARAKRPQS